ncbi:class F sortase [Nocardia sp. NPDC058633]|uniref:class F sortase n=1 Tax=Nocardia sp. NPDC058633 TaxID=3346568 RepID=UPI0036524D80
MTAQPGSRLRFGLRVSMVVVLLAAAAVLFTAPATQVRRQANVPPPPVDTVLPGEAPTAAPLDRSAPIRLEIPAIGLDTIPRRSGVTETGALAAPAEYEQTSWFEAGASPGEAGSAVILGHVDSTAGPAVFFRLGELTAGDGVRVTRQDGSIARFVVDRTEAVDKNEFPADRVFTADGTARLRLITCGGPFDRTAGRYLSNVIVYAVLIDSTGPTTNPMTTHP